MSEGRPLRLGIVIGSTRPGRVGKSVADWLFDITKGRSDFEIDVLDLAEWNLPMLNEPDHPRFGRYQHELTRRWSATIDALDAFVIVTPEYNYGYTAPVKNALDHLYREWNDKAIGFVGYGGIAGGARAVQMLKQVVTTLKMTPVFDAVYIAFVQGHLDETGALRPTPELDAAAALMLDEIARVGGALQSLREQ